MPNVQDNLADRKDEMLRLGAAVASGRVARMIEPVHEAGDGLGIVWLIL